MCSHPGPDTTPGAVPGKFYCKVVAGQFSFAVPEVVAPTAAAERSGVLVEPLAGPLNRPLQFGFGSFSC